jgi:hypothetical protein
MVDREGTGGPILRFRVRISQSLTRETPYPQDLEVRVAKRVANAGRTAALGSKARLRHQGCLEDLNSTPWTIDVGYPS